MSEPLHTVTPLWRSEPLSRALGSDVWMKMDCFQPVASFKLRGMGRACQAAVEQGASHLVTSSGGNAGYAVAWAGRALSTAVTVVVPRTTPEFARGQIRGTGAEVLEHGASWDDAHDHASSLAEQGGTTYIHPFDDPVVWQGHATLIEEASRQGPRPGVVLTVVGGGGLLCGILEGMHRVGWSDVPVVAVETEGAASFKSTLDAGELVTLDAIHSLATTLGARTVAPRLLEWSRRHAITALTVTDRQAVDACLRYADDHRVLVEPSCGAALATLYERHEGLADRGPVLVEVCGGAGVSLDLLREWDRRAG